MYKRRLLSFLGLVLFASLPSTAFAQNLEDIAQNISNSVITLPGLLAAFSYLAGILFATLAVFKTVDHVTNPSQTPMRVPVIRYLVGGALFALPTIFEAAQTAISGGSITNFEPSYGIIATLSGAVGLTGYLGLGNFSSIINSIIFTSGKIPGLVAVVAYLLAIIIATSALYKTRDHVDDPDRVPLKDAVIRYLTAGALFALPNVYDAIYNMIANGGAGFGTTAIELYVISTFVHSSETSEIFDCGLGIIIPSIFYGAGSVGEGLCTLLNAFAAVPSFLIMVSYMLGLIIGLWAILKIRDHVINPSQTALSEGISRLVVSGCFFALPIVAMTIAYSVTPTGSALSVVLGTFTSYEDGGVALTCGATNSLHQAMACFMEDILGPGHVVLNFFCFCAGMIFIMIGISRLMRSAQEGARGPGGIGTVTTFATGGVLISATTILHAFSASFFGTSITTTKAKLTYVAGMSVAEKAAAYHTINAVLKFMIIIGMISFVRGIFILRDVSEGSQQASVMSGMTHMVGGALAVNLGPLLNAIQTTLGVTAFGVTFS